MRGHRRLSRRLCAFPGCGKRLSNDNTSGVCAEHLHRKGYCGCRTCKADAPNPLLPPRISDMPGMRVVLTPRYNGAKRHEDPVTLAREPWA